MGATVVDVAREFQARLRKFEPIVAAAFVEPTVGNELLLCTLLGSDDPTVDAQLAKMQLDLESTFQEHRFVFSTIHLRGRKPEEFISPDALEVVPARRRADAR